MTRNHSLSCTQGGMQNRTHETIFRGFLVKALQRCNIIHAVESTLPFKEGTAGDNGSSYKMDMITSPGSLFDDNPKFKHHGLMLDVTIANPCAPSNLDASVDIAGSALAKTIARKHRHDRGKIYGMMYRLVPLSFSSSGHYCVDMHIYTTQRSR